MRPNSVRHTQGGAAALLLLLLLLVGAGLLLASGLRDTGVELAAQRKTTAALATAKEALVGRAVLDPGGVAVNPGRLPCPDQDKDGTAEGAACAAPYVGWLPWRTLALDDLRDGSGERLWLAVDAAFRSKNAPLNSTVWPTLRVEGRPAVAVIFAPGPPLSQLGQSRAAGGPYRAATDYGNYIESFAATGPTVTLGPPANDRLLVITPEELFGMVTLRLARELARLNPAPYSATSVADLVKPALWTSNHWDDALDAGSMVTSEAITLKLKNCVAVYTISGNTVRRSAPSC
jgi:hypothetical protein